MRELVKITLGASEYGMRPTYEAYGEIEARYGALRLLYTSVVMGTATLATMAGIVKIGTDQAGEALDEKAIGARLYEAGPFEEETFAVVADYLAALGWTPEQRKKREAALKGETGPQTTAL